MPSPEAGGTSLTTKRDARDTRIYLLTTTVALALLSPPFYFSMLFYYTRMAKKNGVVYLQGTDASGGGGRGSLPRNCTYLLDEDGRRASSEFLSLSCGNILTGEESFGRRCRHVEVSSSQAVCLALV